MDAYAGNWAKEPHVSIAHLNSMRDLNRRFLVLADTRSGGWADAGAGGRIGCLGRKVAPLSPAQRAAAANCPYALFDLRFTRRQFAKKMRMSRKELKDEVKQREGDPRVRSRLRELRREMRKRSMSVRNTRNADVLITNPTHVAVALRYEHGSMQAPQLVVSQPMWVPVSPSPRRIRCDSSNRGSTSATFGFPLIVNLIRLNGTSVPVSSPTSS